MSLDQEVQQVKVNRKKNNLSLGQYIARITASIVVPIAGFLGNAKADNNQTAYIPPDFNRANVVDTRAPANEPTYLDEVGGLTATTFTENGTPTDPNEEVDPFQALKEYLLQTNVDADGNPLYNDVVFLDSPTVLDQPDTLYYLTTDIGEISVDYSSYFIITADNVGFHLGGHTITGSETGQCIRTRGYNRLSISNGNIRGFSKAITIKNSEESKIYNMNLNNNSEGIGLNNSKKCDISNIRAKKIVNLGY